MGDTDVMSFATRSRLALAAFVVGCSGSPGRSARAPEVDPMSSTEWARDMALFRGEDIGAPPPPRPVVFTGSSSIRMWSTLSQDFPDLPVLNRGFGGSQMRDAFWYADEVVIRYRPSVVVLYAGDNDLNAGRTPKQVVADFRAFVRRVRRDLPAVRIVYISIKPSPSRAHLMPLMRAANELIRAEAARTQGVEFVDVFKWMLGPDGQPYPALFLEDRLHMNEHGYGLWRVLLTPVLRRAARPRPVSSSQPWQPWSTARSGAADAPSPRSPSAR
jgi:lysophospholipase L1-like esterase